MDPEKSLSDIDGSLERLWQSGWYENPEDLASEVRERLDQWEAGFTDLCYCNRSARHCICP